MGDNCGASPALKCCSGMMTKTQLYARTGAAAIAAVLALSSTQTLAQDAGSTATQPATTTPAPTPVDPVATPDPLAPASAAETSTTSTTTTRTTARHAARPAPVKPAPVAARRTVTRKVTTHTAAAAPAAPVAAAPPAAPAATAKPAPIVDLNAKPAAAPPPAAAAAKPASGIDRNELMLGGGALALIAIAAAAIAMRRRRRHDEDEWAQHEYVEPVAEPQAAMTPEPQMAATPRHDPVFEQQPAIVAPPASAFAWPSQQRSETTDCTEAKSWTERAKCGPTPDNPSASLKKRLKRAAFFEQRERDVAAGEAVAVDPDAGLPEAVDEPADGSNSELERS